jgi:HSP20 family protein
MRWQGVKRSCSGGLRPIGEGPTRRAGDCRLPGGPAQPAARRRPSEFAPAFDPRQIRGGGRGGGVLIVPAGGPKWRSGRLRESLEIPAPDRERYSWQEDIMRSLISYDPMTDLNTDELFRGFFKPVRWESAPAPVMIKMDVTEIPNGYLVHAEMPGVRKEDIDIAIEGNQVTIAAEVKRETEKKEGDRVLRNERYFGNVYRSFTLPAELDEPRCEAKYEKGILELTLMTKTAAPGKKLEIR